MRQLHYYGLNYVLNYVLNYALYYVLCLFWVASSALAHPGQHAQLQRISDAMAQAPDDQGLYIQRGATYSNGGEFALASADLRAAEKLGPPVNVAYEWGLLYHRKKEYTLSRKYFDTYLSAFPTAATAFESRAQLSRERGDYASAVADLERYFSLLERPHPGNFIAAADMLTTMGDTNRALTLLDAGMQKIGTTAQLQRHAIALEKAQGNLDQAIGRQESLREALHESPLWQLEMAELLVLDQRNVQAQDILETLVTQLRSLRETPARLRQMQRAQLLIEQLKPPGEPPKPATSPDQS